MKSTLQIEVLYKWMQCQQYLKTFADKKYMQSLLFFSRHFSDITTSKRHTTKALFDTLMKNVVKFELACSYK
jgi:hypothetical protein